MSDTPARDAKLVSLLNEAYTKERQLETSLEANVEVTTRADYAKRLKAHLTETKSHATQVSQRIKQLGGTPETVSLPGPRAEGLANAAESVSGFVGRAKAAVQAPLHAVRGSGEQEKMLHNARSQYQDEAEEIATYMIIDSLATAVGDKQTAKLARDIRKQEERMQDFLGKLLPELSADVAHDEIPISEIEGGASRGSGANSKPTSRSGRSKSNSSRGKAASSRGKAASSGSKAASTRSKAASTRSKAASPRSKAASSGSKAASSRGKAASNAGKAAASASKAAAGASRAAANASKASSRTKAASSGSKSTSGRTKASSSRKKAKT